MRKDAFRKIPGILARYRRNQAWRKVVRVMACVVVFCTTYALILPAITLEKKPACGLEEHTHTEECYAQITELEKRVPICTLESLNLHRHTEDCQEVGCGYADFVAHKHDDRCYGENGQLWCPIPEKEAHTHDESCYTLPDAHTHGEDCYQKEKSELICTVPEGETAHTHSKEAGCYEETKELTCELAESDGHTHSDACKNENGELTCGLEETEGHQHGDGCYTPGEKLICTISDQPHQHVGTCYDWKSVLTCTASAETAGEPVLTCEKEEIRLHEHTEDCFETDDEGNTYLICGEVQILEHIHTDACFKTEGKKVDTKSRTCGMKEGQGAHAHMESCYDEEKNLICGEGHHHTARCYGEWLLTCGKEEHTHTEACMVDVETEEDWKKTLPEELSGDWREDLLAVAKSQLDYAEARPDFQLGEEPRRWSRYGAWYGQSDAKWNSLFAMFCLHYAEIPEEKLPQDSDISAWVEKLAGRTEGFEKFQLYYSEEDYTPVPGDLVFFGLDEDEAADRVGIVTKYTAAGSEEPAKLETIEGDVSGQVAERKYPMDGVRILGYAQLPEQPIVEPVEPILICGKEEHTHTELCTSLSEDGKGLTVICGKEEHTHTEDCWQMPRTEYTWSQDGLEITASFGPDAVLPENAQLVVERQTPDAPQPLDEMRVMTATASRPIVSESDASPVTDETVGNGLARSSEPDGTGTENDNTPETGTEEQASLLPTDAESENTSLEPDTTSPVGNGFARSSEPDGTGTSNDPTQESTCLDYFQVYLAVDGVPVDPQAQADVQIQLQGQQYPAASKIELVQLTEDSNQTILAEQDSAGNLTANFTGTLAGEYAVMALAADAPRATGTKSAASLTPEKRIDAFRDGVDNPDTDLDNNAENKTDLYRLYLDAVVGPSTQNTPMNMLLVVDRSASMNTSLSGSYGGDSRDQILNKILNGDEKNYGSGYRGNGLVRDFVNMNPDNQIAVVGFSGIQSYTDGSKDASTPLSWTKGQNTVSLGDIESGSGTNYCAAFVEADKMLTEIKAKNSNPTIMVFLSDGRPTYYFDADGKRQGDGQENTTGNVDKSITGAMTYFEKYIVDRHPDVTVYTVGISKDIVGDNTDANKDQILRDMASLGGGQYVGATSSSALKSAISSAWGDKTFTSLRMEDTLSEYVELYEEPDIKVIKTAADGAKTVLWQNNAATAEGTNSVESVLISGDNKKITVTFRSDYELEPGYTYSLSYNVKVTAAAYVYCNSKNYPDIGGANTDYGANTTSSNRFGIYSNKEATISYNSDNTPLSRSFPHPVVQISRPNLTGQQEINVTTHKTIDAFRDSADNPDTTLDDDLTEEEKTDLYRLYLDAELTPQTEPIDLLIVVDQSGSMHQNYAYNQKYNGEWVLEVIPDTDNRVVKDMKDGGTSIYRDEALRMVLNGTYSKDPEDITKYKEKGLIYQFLKANPNNKVAVVGFQGGGENRVYDIGTNNDAETILGWKTGSDSDLYADVDGIFSNSTNYCAGFIKAGEMLQQVQNDGRKKVMLFMSDGEPTTHIEQQADGTYRREGDGGKTLESTETATRKFFEELIGNPNDPNNPNKDLLIHTVSIRANKTAARLQTMASQDVGHCYSVSTTEELQRALAKVMYGTAYVDLVIEDDLSEYVDLYTDQPDYKVTMNGKVLYNGAITTDGQDILQGVNYDKDTKKVTVTFKPTYIPAPGTKVTLSFNVITTTTAYQEYTNNLKQNKDGYGDVKGDPNTDFSYQDGGNTVANATSSEKPGFYSNIAYDPADETGTKLSYKRYNEANQTNKPYPQPVIQVSSGDGPKVPENTGLSFKRSKTIDAFRDGTDNPDTNLDNNATDKTDLYRLYLDATVTGEGNGIDLLIVVDESDSMTTSMDGMTREAVIRKILNGAAYESGYNAESMKEGLIYQFLSMNDKNKLAIVGFYGSRNFTNAYSDAADINGGWKSGVNNVSFVNVETPAGGLFGMQRTNYCAGLKVASDVLRREEVQNDGNKKIMIFLSDGVPTYYMKYENSGRDGSGIPGGRNDNTCAQGTKDYFDAYFAKKHTDVDIYTVGIFPGENGNGEYSTGSDVLKYMVSYQEDRFINAGDAATLQSAMLDFAMRTDVTDLQIVDELSPYVEVHPTQPDYKLTMVENGTVKVLWADGRVTTDGKNIVKSVGYEEITDPDTGAVTKRVVAKFNETYRPRLGCKFTLSFNVQTTEKAYEEYAKNGYTVKGDKGTDYTGNNTSSNQGGFHSNTDAYVQYNRGEERKTDHYRHPVVQAVTCKIVIQKTDSEDNKKLLSGAMFDIYRLALEGETGEAVGTLEGKYVKVPQPLDSNGKRPATDEQGQLVFQNLIPGDYWLVETKAPSGYHKADPIKVTLTRGTNGGGQIEGSTQTVTIGAETLPMLKVPNEPWNHEMPDTGGTGTEPYTVGGMLILCLAFLLLYNQKKHGKGDAVSS